VSKGHPRRCTGKLKRLERKILFGPPQNELERVKQHQRKIRKC
jgi:hypothetical protein